MSQKYIAMFLSFLIVSLSAPPWYFQDSIAYAQESCVIVNVINAPNARVTLDVLDRPDDVESTNQYTIAYFYKLEQKTYTFQVNAAGYKAHNAVITAQGTGESNCGIANVKLQPADSASPAPPSGTVDDESGATIDFNNLPSGPSTPTSATCANGQKLSVPAGASIYRLEGTTMTSIGQKTIAGTATINDNPKDASISGDTSGAKRIWCFSNRWDLPGEAYVEGWVSQYDLKKTTPPVQTVPGVTTSGACISGTTGVVATDVQLAAQEIALVVVSGTVTSTYSSCRDGNSRQHHALDITANTGSAVKSPIVGTVVSSGDCGDLGYCTKINGEYGVWTFGHLQAGSGLQPNTPVQIGTQIGIIGATTSEESSTGPHVHIAVLGISNSDADPAILIKTKYNALSGLPPPTFYPSGAPLVAGVQQTFQITDAIIITDDDKTKSGNQVCVGKNVKLQITVAGHQVGQNLQIGVQQNNEQLLTFTCRPGFNSPTCIYEGGIQSKINEDLTPTTNMISIVPQYGNSFDLTQPKQLTYEAYTDPSCSPYHAYIQLKNPHKPEEDLSRATLTLQNGQCSPSVNERNGREFNTWYCTSSYQSATVTIEVPNVNPTTPPPDAASSRSFNVNTEEEPVKATAGGASDAVTAPAPETPAGQTTTEQASTCTDSDGGKEPNEKGTVTVGELTKLELSDICSDSILKEYYCNSDGTHNSEFINCPNGCKDDGACLSTSAQSTGAVVAKNLAGEVSASIQSTSPSTAGRRIPIQITFDLQSTHPTAGTVVIPIEPNFALYSQCEVCTFNSYKWCSQASRPSSPLGTCKPATEQCGPTEATFFDENPNDDQPVKCPAQVVQEIIDRTDSSKDACEAAVQNGYVWCRNQDGSGFHMPYNTNENLNAVCGPNTQPILNKDACSKVDDIIENIVWNEVIAFATRYAASRSTPKFIQPPNDWEPTDGIEIPAAITKKRGTHVCEDVSAAKINGELDKTNALSSEGSTPLFQAGDPISIKGNVEKYSSTCNGLNLECRDHQILGCKVSDKLFYISLKQQKCSGEYPDTIYKEMEHEKIWDWGFIATVVAGAVLPFFLTDVDTGVSPSGQPGRTYTPTNPYDPYNSQLRYNTYGSQAGSGASLVGIVNSLRGSNNYGSQKEWIMRTGIGIVTSIFSKPDATKERCFTVCGKTYQTKDPSRDTCASYTPPRTTTGTQVKRDAAIPGPKITLSYKEIKYDEEFGCAKNTACGAFANARVDVSLITPSGAVAPLDDTRTDSLGNYDVSFNAPSVDGTFNTVLKVKGVPPVQSATNTQTTGTRDVSASQLGGRT